MEVQMLEVENNYAKSLIQESSSSSETSSSSEEVIDNKPVITETVTESVVESAALLI